jgi:hypothetical protein
VRSWRWWWSLACLGPASAQCSNGPPLPSGPNSADAEGRLASIDERDRRWLEPPASVAPPTGDRPARRDPGDSDRGHIAAALVGARPVNVYVIEHANGFVLFDLGQDRASVTDPDRYFPSQPTRFLYDRLTQFRIGVNETITAQLAARG